MKILKYVIIALLLLIAIFFIRGLLTPTVSYNSEITVDKSSREAWNVMSDESKLTEWIQGLKKVELVSGTPNTVGAVSKIYTEEGGKEIIMTETITDIQPYEHMGLNFTMDFMNMEYSIQFEETGGKTKIKSVSEVEGNGLVSKSIVSFIKGSMKKQEDKNLQNLKKLIEENTTQY